MKKEEEPTKKGAVRYKSIRISEKVYDAIVRLENHIALEGYNSIPERICLAAKPILQTGVTKGNVVLLGALALADAIEKKEKMLGDINAKKAP